MKRQAILAATLLVSALFTVPGSAAAASDEEGRGWLALGDSYASGEGIPGTPARVAEGSGYATQGRDCRRATGVDTEATAWSVSAFRELQDTLDFTEIALVACTGAETDEIDDQIGEASVQRTRWDLATISVGGNDIGFEAVLKGCLDVNNLPWSFFDQSPGCDVEEAELRSRVDRLRATLSGVYDEIADVIVPGGDVIVLGYPHLVEEVERWDSWRRNSIGIGNCGGILSYDVGLLRSVGGYLNEQIAGAVADANARHADDAVYFHFLDISRDPYEYSDRATDRHGLCSQDPWLNGVTFGFESGDLREEARSFHPRQVGHTRTGQVLARYITDHVDLGDEAPTCAEDDFREALDAADQGDALDSYLVAGCAPPYAVIQGSTKDGSGVPYYLLELSSQGWQVVAQQGTFVGDDQSQPIWGCLELSDAEVDVAAMTEALGLTVLGLNGERRQICEPDTTDVGLDDEGVADGDCPLADVIAAWEDRPQDCIDPDLLGHLFYSGTVLTARFADTYRQDVAFVQLALRDAGYDIEVDGKYGEQTEDVVAEYQADKGLTVDGEVGPRTWESLFGLGPA